jgi:hypothetical protein
LPDKRLLYVELDTGTETYTQVEQRQRKGYRGVQDLLLYVTLSDQRLEGLVAHANFVKRIALFTTLAKVKQDPYGDIWVDCFGDCAALPKISENQQ